MKIQAKVEKVISAKAWTFMCRKNKLIFSSYARTMLVIGPQAPDETRVSFYWNSTVSRNRGNL